jgi:hypothetical protein
MDDPVIGYRPGDRVLVTVKKAERSRGRAISAAMIVSGPVKKVIVAKRGQRFALVEDDFGDHHHADFDQLTAA